MSDELRQTPHEKQRAEHDEIVFPCDGTEAAVRLDVFPQRTQQQQQQLFTTPLKHLFFLGRKTCPSVSAFSAIFLFFFESGPT